MKPFVDIVKFIVPFAVGIGILWWMYRGNDWSATFQMLASMRWNWMLVSLAFGIVPLALRAQRWRLALQPLDEHPTLRVCTDAIFISYAASLVVPRIGEVTRCGTLKTYAGTSFTKALGTVVAERMVDSLLRILLTVGAALIPNIYISCPPRARHHCAFSSVAPLPATSSQPFACSWRWFFLPY